MKELNPSKDLKIDVKKINKELRDYPLLFYKYVKAKNDLKFDISEIKAEIRAEEGKFLQEVDTKGMKVREIEALFATDERIAELNKERLELEATLSEFEDVIKALQYKNHK